MNASTGIIKADTGSSVGLGTVKGGTLEGAGTFLANGWTGAPWRSPIPATFKTVMFLPRP
jgi:hypothetical protein